MTFTGAFDFLSNFYPARVEVGGVCYSNAEAAFQAQKCVDAAERGEFAELVAVKAKRRGRQVKLRPHWDSVRLGVMEEVVRAKFRQNSDLAARLLGTGRLPLAEGNSWGDLFWGVDVKTGKGENHLGRILMKIREEFSEIIGHAREDNVSSRRVLEKAGFVHVETSGGTCKYEIALQCR